MTTTATSIILLLNVAGLIVYLIISLVDPERFA